MHIGIIGTGHVGLVTCASLAANGHEVVGTDADRERIRTLLEGIMPFHEPGLEELVRDSTSAGRLAFTGDPSEALAGADVVFICVGTPPRASGESNLVAVEQAGRDVATHATGPTVVVEKSTVPAGTAHRLRRALRLTQGEGDHPLEVVSNPEFLREGSAMQDALHPDRILIGAESPWAFQQMRRVYEPFSRSGTQIIETDIQTAELAKHACNAFLALKISYTNSLARICERAGADVLAIAEVMGTDPRIGRPFLNAGMGYGGSCLPKDLQAFDQLALRLGYEFTLLREIVKINNEALEATLEKIKDGLWNLEDKRITLLGLSFKPGTDDIRFAPALALARRLIEEGASVVGYDPAAMGNAKEEIPELELALDPYEAAAGSHCLVISTEWPEFRELDLARLRSLLAFPVLVDGRNLFTPEEMREAGFTYYPTGRPAIA